MCFLARREFRDVRSTLERFCRGVLAIKRLLAVSNRIASASSLGRVRTDNSTKDIMSSFRILLRATDKLKPLNKTNASVAENGCDDRLRCPIKNNQKSIFLVVLYFGRAIEIREYDSLSYDLRLQISLRFASTYV